MSQSHLFVELCCRRNGCSKSQGETLRSVGWISFCLVSCICGGVMPVHAQSLYDLVSQTARTASPAPEPAEPVELSTHESTQTDAPGSPETASTAEVEQTVVHSPPEPERKPAVAVSRPKPEASWPVTLTIKSAGTAAETTGHTASTKAGSWSAAEIASARAVCAQIFKSLDVVTLPEEPIKEGPCGDPAPVRLVSIGTVTLSPPPIVNCQMVEAMHRWLSKDLQPLARKHLRSPITTINVMSSYSCRNAYGRARGSLSEHARANALDIRGFVTKKGAESELLAHWGPTKKELAEAKRIAAERAAAAKTARLAEAQRKREARQQAMAARKAGKAEAERALTAELAPPMRADATPAITMLGATAGRFYRTLVEDEADAAGEIQNEPDTMGSEAQKLGGPKIEAAAVQVPEPKTTIAPAKAPRRAVNTQYARFLREAHTSACRIFGTVLGPEANKAHLNHFHIDLAERNRGNYCR